MRSRVRAIRALRLNYTRRGVWRWLRAHGGRPGRPRWPYRKLTPVKLYGWQRLLYEPERVIAEQNALAEGNFA